MPLATTPSLLKLSWPKQSGKRHWSSIHRDSFSSFTASPKLDNKQKIEKLFIDRYADSSDATPIDAKGDEKSSKKNKPPATEGDEKISRKDRPPTTEGDEKSLREYKLLATKGDEKSPKENKPPATEGDEKISREDRPPTTEEDEKSFREDKLPATKGGEKRAEENEPHATKGDDKISKQADWSTAKENDYNSAKAAATTIIGKNTSVLLLYCTTNHSSSVHECIC